MARLLDIPTPALVLDRDKLDANLERMARKAERLGTSLRPHIKTHKSIEIAERQRDLGARGITVSTLHEAKIFAAFGFDDITWAFPLIVGRAKEVGELAERLTLRVLVDSAEAVATLENLGVPVHVWLKVDCGYHRAGVDPSSPQATELAERLSSNSTLIFDGLLTHSGHAYQADSPADRLAVAEQERDVMTGLAGRLRDGGIRVPAVSVGSTPAMAVIEDLTGIDEVRPGNYALYDYMQVDLGSCETSDCAVTVLTSVVSRGAGHSVVDAGALALSKDAGPPDERGHVFGRFFYDYPGGHLSDDVFLTSLSQEHGIVNQAMPVGTRLRLLPNHSCLTVAQFDEYVVAEGEEVVDRWRIRRGRG